MAGSVLAKPEDDRIVRLAEPRRGLDDGIEARAAAATATRLMTLSTSLVAVWYSSDSCSSRVRACTSSNSRTFSIAITAWSAKVVTSSICLSVKGRSVRRMQRDDADRTAVAQQRHAEHRAL